MNGIHEVAGSTPASSKGEEMLKFVGPPSEIRVGDFVFVADEDGSSMECGTVYAVKYDDAPRGFRSGWKILIHSGGMELWVSDSSQVGIVRHTNAVEPGSMK